MRPRHRQAAVCGAAARRHRLGPAVPRRHRRPARPARPRPLFPTRPKPARDRPRPLQGTATRLRGPRRPGPLPPAARGLHLVLGGGRLRRRWTRTRADQGRGRAGPHPQRPRRTLLQNPQAGRRPRRQTPRPQHRRPDHRHHRPRSGRQTQYRMASQPRNHHRRSRTRRTLRDRHQPPPPAPSAVDRIQALIAVIGIALLVFGLIEADLRRALGPDTPLPAILPEHRDAVPTARAVLTAFAGLHATYTTTGLLLDRLTPTQRLILAHLDIPLPWPETPSTTATSAQTKP